MQNYIQLSGSAIARALADPQFVRGLTDDVPTHLVMVEARITMPVSLPRLEGNTDYTWTEITVDGIGSVDVCQFINTVTLTEGVNVLYFFSERAYQAVVGALNTKSGLSCSDVWEIES
jgi:hypothetical protein